MLTTNVEPVPPEEARAIRDRLAWRGWTPEDREDLWRLRATGQLVECYLYHHTDTKAITAFTAAEAEELLGYMVFDGAHQEDFITESNSEGERKRSTWRTEVSTPDLSKHLEGTRFFGLKKGAHEQAATRMIVLDLDYRGGPGGDLHIDKAVKAGAVLARRFPQLRFAPEVNPRNGSVKFCRSAAAV